MEYALKVKGTVKYELAPEALKNFELALQRPMANKLCTTQQHFRIF